MQVVFCAGLWGWLGVCVYCLLSSGGGVWWPALLLGHSASTGRRCSTAGSPIKEHLLKARTCRPWWWTFRADSGAECDDSGIISDIPEGSAGCAAAMGAGQAHAVCRTSWPSSRHSRGREYCCASVEDAVLSLSSGREDVATFILAYSVPLLTFCCCDPSSYVSLLTSH